MFSGSGERGGRGPGAILSGIADIVQLAEDYLNEAVDASHGYDPQVVSQIRADLASLDAFLARLTEVRTMRDDTLFRKAAVELRSQVPALQAVSDSVKRTASDTATPPGVGGYMEQTVTLLAQAVELLRELP
ncbi:MAG TPA: hypothetical protein PKN85_02355 [Syntrophorhabdaceae bacterium]|nr:hypothetical protein [Syntrophorhabdaceae bacterium]